MSAHLWWLRRLACVVRGHVPDGVVRGGDDRNGSGGVMWCKRRCGSVLRAGRGWTR